MRLIFGLISVFEFEQNWFFINTGMFHSQQTGAAQDEVPDEPSIAIQPPGWSRGILQSKRVGGELCEKEHRAI